MVNISIALSGIILSLVGLIVYGFMSLEPIDIVIIAVGILITVAGFIMPRS